LNDSIQIVRQYLLTTGLSTLVSGRIYSPRAPESAALPNVTMFIRGGESSPYIPDIPKPSFQIDCWSNDFVEARTVYRTLYNALQGVQNEKITYGMPPVDYYIMSAIEEVQGQDITDVDIPGRYRVLSYWKIITR